MADRPDGITPPHPRHAEEPLRPAGRQQALEWLAVLAAAGIDAHPIRHRHYWLIFVPADRADDAARQVDAFETESRIWPPPPPTPVRQPHPDSLVSLAVAVALVAGYHVAGPGGASPAGAAGAADAVRILSGEYWRIITAATLHADFGHVFANAVACAIFGSLLGRAIGPGAAWFAILCTAAAANTLTAWSVRTHYTSIGASTGVFGAIGLLAGLRLHDHLRDRAIGFRDAWMPVAATLALTAVMSGSPGIDRRGHFYGALCGLLLGVVLRPLHLHRLAPVWQALLVALTGGAVTVAWVLALR